MSRVFLVVHGIVQGVGYRHFVRSAATKLGIRGFVRNADDGSVEILVESAINDAIQSFTKEINVDMKYGPQVFKIEANNEMLKKFEKEEFDSFEVL